MPTIAIFAAERARCSALEALARANGTLIDTASDAPSLDRLLTRRSADLVLAEGLDDEALGALAAAHPATRFVVFDDDSEPLDLILAGAAAVLPHDAGAALIASALALATSDLRLLPEIAFERLRTLAGAEPPRSGGVAPILTPREREVLAAMADGASNKVIARRLGISFHTAKFHVASILAKLDADTRTEALARAARIGLVML